MIWLRERIKVWRYIFHAKRCKKPVTVLSPPDATEDQFAIELCDDGVWHIQSMGRHWVGLTFDSDLFDAMRSSSEGLAAGGLPHLASSVTRLCIDLERDLGINKS